MPDRKYTLVVNPGSASRKYALFLNETKIAAVWFEYLNNKVIGRIDFNGSSKQFSCPDENLDKVSRYLLPLFIGQKIISSISDISVIGIRVVAPNKAFLIDQIDTPKVELILEQEEELAPLHIATELSEIEQLKISLPGIPIVDVSDSEFHATKPKKAWYYGIDYETAEKFGIMRYGYHGVSVESVINRLDENDLLKSKVVVCHLGSGCSITAVLDGKSIDNTMGYTPAEGLTMATRSGSIDFSAALAIKKRLNLDDDKLEEYLNKKSGLLGLSGTSNDIRQLLESEAKGDERAKIALDVFVYKIIQAIGQMVASLNGADSIVFTATVGERSSIIRQRILDNLEYLGFKYDKELNNNTYEPKLPTNIANSSSKSIIVISTDEALEIAKRANKIVL